jgi:hypothetical protein
MEAEYILNQLGITTEVLNIYPYGSHVYGCATEDSDHDYIIVAKSSLLPSGAFKDNAISSGDYKIQGVLYSRTGFIDAINNFDVAAMECLFLPDEMVIQNKWDFKIQKWDEKALLRKIVTKASNSWYIADRQAKDGYKDRAKKGVYHALRILTFGKQLKDNKRIVDYSAGNIIRLMINKDRDFDTRSYIAQRDSLMDELRGDG